MVVSRCNLGRPLRVFAYLAALALAAAGAGAQIEVRPAPQRDDTYVRLHRPVTLQAGTTSIGDALAALERQPGVHIEAPAYVCQRRLVLHIRSVSALAVLDTIAQLGEWQ